MRKRIVIVESRASIREMLQFVIAAEGSYDVVGLACAGLEAVEMCGLHKPHLVILSLDLPELSGAEVIRRLRKKVPETRTLIFTDCHCIRMVSDAMRSKPHGFITRTESLRTLREAIAAVMAGRIYFSAFPSRVLSTLSDARTPLLSQREREIAQMTVEGQRSKEIAERLGISVKTVENHRAHVMEKLHVRSAVDLTRYAVYHGWVGAGAMDESETKGW